MVISNPTTRIKISSFDYVFVFLCVIFIGSATLITYGGLDNFGFGNGGALYEPLIGKAFMLLYSMALLIRHKIRIWRTIDMKILVVLIVWGAAQFVKYSTFSMAPVTRIMNLYFLSVLLFVYGKDLFSLLENILYKLAVIGTILWLLHLTMPELIEAICSISPFEGAGMVRGKSILVFAPNYHSIDVYRNFGFAWEPGRFGCLMTYGIFLNLVLYRFKINHNSHLIWLTAAMLSTLSTTAYMVFLLIIAVYFYNKNPNIRFFLLPVFGVLIYYLLSLDFMLAKINELSIFNEDAMAKWEEGLSYYGSPEYGEVYTPQRFQALLLEGMNILHDPLIGNAGNPYGYLYSVFGVNMSLSNGALRVFANMGIPLGALYYYICAQGSKWFSEEFHFKGKYAFLFFFILINFSYAFIFEPLFLALLFYPYIKKRNPDLVS